MRRVLMVSPHFPPDTSAGTHRVRLLAPHLARYGWEPTIVSVDPRDYEGRLDDGLARLVPPGLRVVRCRAWSVALTRRLGLGDLGLRAFSGLYRTCARLLAHERFDAVFITIYRTYPAVMGPLLKRRFRLPFVLDYQDPWVGSWGKTVGPGRDGKPDLKSRLTRALAAVLEPRVAGAADAITAVSAGTFEEIQARNPRLRRTPCAAIPLGGEASDFERLRTEPRKNRYFDPTDGKVHLCYVGTLLPLGFETLRAVLRAVRLLGDRQPEHYARFRLYFFGTSNLTAPDAAPRVLPVARELGVDDCVTEIAPRIDYLDALTVQTQATAILMMGSSERHYTASKLYPGLLARRPLLAIYHEASSVVEVLRRATRPPTARLVTYGDLSRAEARTEEVYAALVALVGRPQFDSADVNLAAVEEFSAEALAGRLAAVLERVRQS
jgi:glycosyltransferase involved in cell wall biosynthesis